MHSATMLVSLVAVNADPNRFLISACDQKEAMVKVSAKKLWRRRMREHKL